MEATELTWAEQMFERGRQQGEQQGEQRGEQRGMREAIRQMLRARFGAVSPALDATLESMAREEELAAFIERAAVAHSEAELLP